MGLPCRGSYEAIFGARQAIPGVSGAILGSFLVLGRPGWEAMRGTLGLGRAMLHILEAILWPRWLPRANMSSQHEERLVSLVDVAHFCSGEFSAENCHRHEKCRILVDVTHFCSGELSAENRHVHEKCRILVDVAHFCLDMLSARTG